MTTTATIITSTIMRLMTIRIRMELMAITTPMERITVTATPMG